MLFQTLCLHYLRLFLLAALLICQYPSSSEAGRNSFPSIALLGLLYDLNFSDWQVRRLMDSAEEDNLASSWSLYGQESYDWLKLHLPVDTRKLIMSHPWLLG